MIKSWLLVFTLFTQNGEKEYIIEHMFNSKTECVIFLNKIYKNDKNYFCAKRNID